MSIDDEILDRVKRGMLYCLLPAAAGAPIRRAMFISEALWRELESPAGDDEWEIRIGKLRADLESFLIEDFIPPKYLFLLYPSADGVWEIRSVQDAPSIRVMGQFPIKDTFVSTNYALRERLYGWQSREWKATKRAAKAAWRVLFNPYSPIITTNVNDVISGAVNGKYFKD